MNTKVCRMVASTLLAGLAFVAAAPAADARRNSPPNEYVPAPEYGEDPGVGPEEDPYANPVAPTVVTVVLPEVVTDTVVTEIEVGLAGDGERAAPAPEASSPESSVLSENLERQDETHPATGSAAPAGLLSRTGAESMALARAGLAAVALGAGLVLVSRRRRQAASV
ncbi:MAG TPA: hypothetical protein VEG38_20905 [Acidimicrobiia bacterium]|nr:hypothetical protein [Acidimicrobiia bacterium]